MSLHQRFRGGGGEREGQRQQKHRLREIDREGRRVAVVTSGKADGVAGELKDGERQRKKDDVSKPLTRSRHVMLTAVEWVSVSNGLVFASQGLRFRWFWS